MPALDAITLDLVERWDKERNASIAVEISQDWRLLTERAARDARGADIGELFGNQPHLFSDQLVDVSELAERAGESLGGWSNAVCDTCSYTRGRGNLGTIMMIWRTVIAIWQRR